MGWCKKVLQKADLITHVGKNWYVYWNGISITINTHSYTIITAHKINAKIRTMVKSDYICLNEFLYQAIFVPNGEALPPRSVVYDPKIFIYIKEFGTMREDLGVVAE
ncbi:MAG: DUF3781 domain-containing protein [Bacilli bacterium]